MREEAMSTPPNARPVALVTGAGRGLGAATAAVFAEAGYAVAALDLAAPPTDGAITGYACDVSDEGAVASTVAVVAGHLGRIDVAVSCAGIDHTLWLEQMTVAQFDQILAVNLRGPFLVAKAVWPVMKAHGGGHIVNIASTAAVRTWSGASAYHASKFGLVGLSRGLNLEGRQDNIRVTTVIPGGMNTGFFERFVEQGIPLPDPATLQDPVNVARTILYAVQLPPDSVLQEVVITPPNEGSWP
jgi:NAD(P)-dependent dehydrogenase (short-subunit alcohol dehydrogenase family)